MRIDEGHKERNLYWWCGVILLSCSTIGWSQNASQLPTPTEIFKKVSHAVVLVVAGDDKTISQGTGFLVSEDGRIVTNYHVIEHMKAAGVKLASGDVYEVVDIVDVDKHRDLVILKIKAVELPYLTLGKSANIEPGAKVYTISNPRGFENTLSEGIVSAVREEDGSRKIQFTAPISHGSSGGPVFDGSGNVIAVVQATDEEAQNVNFAIPIEYVKGLLTTTGTRPLISIFEPPPPSSSKVSTTPPSPDSKSSAESVPPANSTPSRPTYGDPRRTDGNNTIDGSWSATTADSKASGNLDFNLIQNSDGQVVGTYTSSLGGGGSIKGQLTETDFRFELTQTIQGCPGIYKGTGTRIGDHIAGSYTGNDCLGDRGTGTFTMTRGTTAQQPSIQSTSSVSPVPDEMRKSVGDFLATRLLVWSEQDAQKVMGDPLSHRFAYDQARNVTGDIYTFRDPTLNADHIELGFDSKTNRLTNVYLYPVRLTTWEDCKKLWGNDAKVAIKNPDGSKIYAYKNRHVNVLLDKNNRVVSLGLY
jgi:S1-C subfamily serine protease